MQITAISDTHGRHHSVTIVPTDILIHAGDWTSGRDIGFCETEEFLAWMSAQPANHKILIAGNHELTVEKYPDYFREILSNYPDIIYLEDSGVIIDNINFYGSPRSNQFYNWAFMGSENQLWKHWAAIPDDINVLITHGPARHMLDWIVNGRHVGSQTLTDHKQKLVSLQVHICGHIHEQHGKYTENGIININASLLNDKYKLTYEPIIFNIKDK